MRSLIRHFIIAFTLSLLFSTPVLSVTEVPKTVKPIISIGLTPTVGGYFFSSEQSLKPAPIYGLKFSYDHIGTSIYDSLGFEATANYFSTKTKGTNLKTSGMIFRADATYSIGPRNTWVPFMALGGGGLFIDRSGARDNSPFLSLGLGVKYFFEDYLALRFDARQLFVYNAVATSNNYELSTGLTYFFGKERKKKSAPAPKKPTTRPKAVPTISDSDSQEPEGPELSMFEKLGAVGAAILGITTEPPDYEPPVLVTELGPRVEAAPATTVKAVPLPEPVPVQPEMAQISQTIRRLLTVEFDFGSPELRPVYRDEIAAAAALIKSSIRSSVVIEGHTDIVGRHQPNMVLSQKRARSVKDELVRHGVDPKIIAIKGFGFTKPTATNKTDEGRQRNRRALAVIISVVNTAAPGK